MTKALMRFPVGYTEEDSITISGTTKIFWNRDTEGYPVVDFAVSEGDGVCNNKD